MSSFRPGAVLPGRHLQYSPWVQPMLGGEVKCVRVDGKLEEFSAMAYRFVVNFARDNDLQIEPQPAAAPAPQPGGAAGAPTPSS